MELKQHLLLRNRFSWNTQWELYCPHKTHGKQTFFQIQLLFFNLCFILKNKTGLKEGSDNDDSDCPNNQETPPDRHWAKHFIHNLPVTFPTIPVLEKQKHKVVSNLSKVNNRTWTSTPGPHSCSTSRRARFPVEPQLQHSEVGKSLFW